MSTSNLFRRLRELFPTSTVIVGIVEEHNDDDTSTVRIPGPEESTNYSKGITSGALIRARGRTVPVGMRAFIRDGVIETQAPSDDVTEYIAGKVVLEEDLPPMPALTAAFVPTPTGVNDIIKMRSTTGELLHAAAYSASAGVTVVGMGGTFYTVLPAGCSLSVDNKTLTFPEPVTTVGTIPMYPTFAGQTVFSTVGLADLADGDYAMELVIQDRKGAVDLRFGTTYYGLT